MVEDTYSVSANATWTLKCNAPEWLENKDEIGMWVYVVHENGDNAKATPNLGSCRYGAGQWNVEPECPYSACIDISCTKCRDWMA